jgi:hypothetical protein
MQLAQGPVVTGNDTESPKPGHAALRIVDKLLVERPTKVGHDFSEATRCLSAFRDELIDHCRRNPSTADRQRLTSVNTVLAIVVGAHFPLGDIPWPKVEQARSLLATALNP